ncbi:MAG: hypothetical protein IPL59_16775 [Candidatus Competibacteraceae bacterium]|nr:hypothetical protein [Candidatus Competibacteraceae bacterium]
MDVMLELLDRDCIVAGLTDAARAGLSQLEVYPVLDSTNSYLLSKVHEDWPSGSVCLAEQQQAGRGRRDDPGCHRLLRVWLVRCCGDSRIGGGTQRPESGDRHRRSPRPASDRRRRSGTEMAQ